jgi:hypothetical protein
VSYCASRNPQSPCDIAAWKPTHEQLRNSSLGWRRLTKAFPNNPRSFFGNYAVGDIRADALWQALYCRTTTGVTASRINPATTNKDRNRNAFTAGKASDFKVLSQVIRCNRGIVGHLCPLSYYRRNALKVDGKKKGSKENYSERLFDFSIRPF